MIATFVSLRVIKHSMLPRLEFDIEISSDSPGEQVLIYGWTGELYLQHPQYMLIGNLSTNFASINLMPKDKQRIQTSCEVSPEKLDIIEDQRKGANLQINIILNILCAHITQGTGQPTGVNTIRSEKLTVKAATDEGVIVIPRSIWDDRLEELNYGSIMTLRFAFPPLPLETQLVKSINFIKDAQKKINDGEWGDSLVSCRKSIEELQKLWGKNDEKRKAFLEKILDDEKKAEACGDLWRAIQKAKDFTSGGGAHNYWIKTADKRDAELAIRVVSAFVHYFAHNLARGKGRIGVTPGLKRRKHEATP